MTENEKQDLEVLGGFVDRVGHVRNMVQSHLLQMPALTLTDPEGKSLSGAKL